jgi:hypothetical protein
MVEFLPALLIFIRSKYSFHWNISESMKLNIKKVINNKKGTYYKLLLTEEKGCVNNILLKGVHGNT